MASLPLIATPSWQPLVYGLAERWLSINPEIHRKVLIDMGLDDEYQAIGTMIMFDGVMATTRFKELYNKKLRNYAVEEYHLRKS